MQAATVNLISGMGWISDYKIWLRTWPCAGHILLLYALKDLGWILTVLTCYHYSLSKSHLQNDQMITYSSSIPPNCANIYGEFWLFWFDSIILCPWSATSAICHQRYDLSLQQGHRQEMYYTRKWQHLYYETKPYEKQGDQSLQNNLLLKCSHVHLHGMPVWLYHVIMSFVVCKLVLSAWSGNQLISFSSLSYLLLWQNKKKQPLYEKIILGLKCSKLQKIFWFRMFKSVDGLL